MQMSTLLFPLTFLLGVAMGTCFRVYVLVPAAVILVFAEIVAWMLAGMPEGALTVWQVVLSIVAMQFGYLAGVGVRAVKSSLRSRKWHAPQRN